MQPPELMLKQPLVLLQHSKLNCEGISCIFFLAKAWHLNWHYPGICKPAAQSCQLKPNLLTDISTDQHFRHLTSTAQQPLSLCHHYKLSINLPCLSVHTFPSVQLCLSSLLPTIPLSSLCLSEASCWYV